MTLSRMSYGRVMACLMITLAVAGVFYFWLAGASSLGLAALAISILLASTCVGFTFWSLGFRLVRSS